MINHHRWAEEENKYYGRTGTKAEKKFILTRSLTHSQRHACLIVRNESETNDRFEFCIIFIRNQFNCPSTPENGWNAYAIIFYGRSFRPFPISFLSSLQIRFALKPLYWWMWMCCTGSVCVCVRESADAIAHVYNELLALKCSWHTVAVEYIDKSMYLWKIESNRWIMYGKATTATTTSSYKIRIKATKNRR